MCGEVNTVLHKDKFLGVASPPANRKGHLHEGLISVLVTSWTNWQPDHQSSIVEDGTQRTTRGEMTMRTTHRSFDVVVWLLITCLLGRTYVHAETGKKDHLVGLKLLYVSLILSRKSYTGIKCTEVWSPSHPPLVCFLLLLLLLFCFCLLLLLLFFGG